MATFGVSGHRVQKIRVLNWEVSGLAYVRELDVMQQPKFYFLRQFVVGFLDNISMVMFTATYILF